jgi:LDH2 family malate/lactate/ureidoglycolate dehydrogenase
MACTAAAVERIIKAKERGEPIPPGWALDKNGADTTDPEAALASLALLPFGGYKAFGLGMVHEILTSVLAGGALFAGDAKGFAPYDAPMNTSFSMLAFDIASFRPLADFEATMEAMLEAVKGSRLREAGGRILFPGERAQAEFHARKKVGIPVATSTWIQLLDRSRASGLSDLAPPG